MAREELDNTVVLEDVRLVFRNFAGKEGPYNREGDRKFSVILDEETAARMAADGWNIKQLNNRDDDEDTKTPFLEVAVNFRGRPPRLVMITSNGREELTEETVDILDWTDNRKVDLIVRPYEWSVQGKTGVKAYLKSIYVTINEDPLEMKYNEAFKKATEEPHFQ